MTMMSEGSTSTNTHPRPERLREKLKPAASQHTHLLTAASLWSIVGVVLIIVGVRWSSAGGPYRFVWLAIAIVVGIAKARFVLRKTAGRTVRRIRARGDGKCLGGFISPASWVLVACMMGGGKYLRSGALPLPVVGLIYAGVGVALFTASQDIWSAWRADRDAARLTSSDQV